MHLPLGISDHNELCIYLNKLAINYSKSVYILTRSMKYLCNPTAQISIKDGINNVSLQATVCVNYLGVFIDNR